MRRAKTALTSSALAELTGVSLVTIRHYENIGLVPSPDHTAGGHRRYSEDDAHRLIFIRRCRAIGFSLERIRSLTKAMEERDPSDKEAEVFALKRLIEVRAKKAELAALEDSLVGFLRVLEAAWSGVESIDYWPWSSRLARSDDTSNPTAK
jgi:DNA-binding transcriptional MerR regulator